MKRLYLLLSLVGLVLPYAYFVPFLLSNGLDLRLFAAEMFANAIASFFAVDVIISSVVFWVFLYRETKARGIKEWWICIIANLTVGLSLALPLFLYFREGYRER